MPQDSVEVTGIFRNGTKFKKQEMCPSLCIR
jgi:hypothetical protein